MGSTITMSTNTLAFDAAGKTIKWSDAAADFVAAGFTNVMLLETNSTNNSTKTFSIKTVAATVLTLYEAPVTQAEGAVITLEAHPYLQVGYIRSFNGPSGNANVIDITHLGSTAKEKLIGLRDEGQLSFDVLFEAADTTVLHQALMRDRAARTLRRFDMKFTDGGSSVGDMPSGVTFRGYVSGFSITGSVDNAITGNVTVEITSALSWREKSS